MSSGSRPLKALTVHLYDTYSKINATAAAPPDNAGSSSDDAAAHDYAVRPGECMHQRYMVDSVIGKGSFGQVVKAFDRVSGTWVAIKLIKRLKVFTAQAQTEIRILRHLKRRDPLRRWHIVTMMDSFVHDGHQCIVFEMLSSNLYEVLRGTRFRGLSLTLVRHVGRQLAEALHFLDNESIISCDLKPENILLQHPHRFEVKVIDFGSACFESEQIYTYIQSRFYRAPEVLIGDVVTTAIDMWSLGCILVELYTVQHVAGVLGLPPRVVVDRSRKAHVYFEYDQFGHCVLRGGAPGRASSVSKLASVISEHVPIVRHSQLEHTAFLNLLHRMLEFDPRVRIRPSEALTHPFLRDEYARPQTANARLRSAHARPVHISDQRGPYCRER
ncbi:hypothetical protein PBRA_001164 [Plasmodiophora brassicae]|uniref:Protein kinase domain-containing protein n=1 Tax=Plasmodiophora brassicae TaxID=37360 RepID=A0A0G4IVJ3_PLABS|nr:hypothetical protein PBRA_001164 [Plasmodiophora brassicae]